MCHVMCCVMLLNEQTNFGFYSVKIRLETPQIKIWDRQKERKTDASQIKSRQIGIGINLRLGIGIWYQYGFDFWVLVCGIGSGMD